MKKHFAEIDSEGPDISNMQRRFWELAVEAFEEIKVKWRDHAVPDAQEDPDADDPPYQAQAFEVDAAVALVLAGTSISELLGQNLPSLGARVPSITEAWKILHHTEAPQALKDFVKVYDAIRHFGPSKHQMIRQITEESFCNHFHAAQNVWESMLRLRGMPLTPPFDHTFDFTE